MKISRANIKLLLGVGILGAGIGVNGAITETLWQEKLKKYMTKEGKTQEEIEQVMIMGEIWPQEFDENEKDGKLKKFIKKNQLYITTVGVSVVAGIIAGYCLKDNVLYTEFLDNLMDDEIFKEHAFGKESL